MKTITITEEQIKSLENVVDYLYLDEIKDYKANGKPKGHIFTDLYTLAGLLLIIKK
jgi:hypothetical protein